MTAFERFDVLTALFPFIDVPVRKPRPVLVLLRPAFNAENGQIGRRIGRLSEPDRERIGGHLDAILCAGGA